MIGRLVVALFVVGATTACGNGDDTAEVGTASTSSTAPETSSTTAKTDKTAGTSGGKNACAALPRATIQEVVGADPGEGELERAANNTICRYYGDAKVTVEIDPGSEVAAARDSVEAYGDTCQTIDDIGEEALFCTGGFPAEGLTGQIVWTDGEHTLFVVYNFGDAAPSKDIPLELARRLQT